MLKACIGLNCARQIDFIDRRNCQLQAVPDDVFRYEATLEELNLDTNAIQELPQVQHYIYQHRQGVVGDLSAHCVQTGRQRVGDLSDRERERVGDLH